VPTKQTCDADHFTSGSKRVAHIGRAQDFTSAKTYTVTAEDGSTQDYVVTVNNLKNTEKQITAFTIAGQVSSAIDQAAKTVLVTMPFGTIKTNLTDNHPIGSGQRDIGNGAGLHFIQKPTR
jgi:hypothetical protein